MSFNHSGDLWLETEPTHRGGFGYCGFPTRREWVCREEKKAERRGCFLQLEEGRGPAAGMEGHRCRKGILCVVDRLPPKVNRGNWPGQNGEGVIQRVKCYQATKRGQWGIGVQHGSPAQRIWLPTLTQLYITRVNTDVWFDLSEPQFTHPGKGTSQIALRG